MAIMGLCLLLAGIHQAPYFASCRILVSRLVQPMMTCSWRVVPVRVTALVVRGYQAYVHYWFRQSENNFLVSGMFVIIVLIGIPAGALFNAVRGGSPFLLIFLASLAFVFITLAILSETNRLKGLAMVLSTFLFLSLFVFVPGYVFHSLTDRLINLSVGRAVIGSFLVFPLLYLAAQSGVLVIAQFFPNRIIDGVGQLKHQLITFAAGLPFAYLLTFTTFLADRVSEVTPLIPMTWQTLLLGVVIVSISISLTVQICGWGERQLPIRTGGLVTLINFAAPAVVVVVVLTTVGYQMGTAQHGFWADLRTPPFGPLFWILELTFLPIVVTFVFQGVLILARIISHVLPEHDWVTDKDTSRACVLVGSSSLLIGGLATMLISFI